MKFYRRKKAPSSKLSRAEVFAVHKNETMDGRYHEVMWAKDGDLNAAYRRGDVKRFRLWGKAKCFANQKGKRLGANVTID